MFKIGFNINSNMNRQRRLYYNAPGDRPPGRFKLPPDNSKTLAKIWPSFVNIDKRMKKEVPFILGRSHKRNPKVFDAALGSGATSIGLKLFGINFVVSNEIDGEMRLIALSEASKRHVNLELASYDWTKSFPLLLEGKFDVVTCLGNSLTCVLNPDGRFGAIKNFRKLLAPEGVLIIDERNYPRILEGDFSHSGEYVYCGTDKVACRPAQVSNDLVVMEYEHLETGEKAYLELYPFKEGEMFSLLKEAEFPHIKVYTDYKQTSCRDVEFYTYVAMER
jgi:SAM-dependent methyltransferase